VSANDRQVGGLHYKNKGEEHWDRQFRLFGPGYLIGQITKYVERYQTKNGIQDLEKAEHFIQKLIELEKAKLQPVGDAMRKINAVSAPAHPYACIDEDAEETYSRGLARAELDELKNDPL